MRRLARTYDPAPLAPLFDPRAQPVVFDPAVVAEELARVRPALFQRVGPLALRAIAEGAFVVQLEAGDLVVRRGTADREMYLVLEGELDVEGRVRIREGETMGEMGFLGTPGVRTATVHATARARLLVLHRHFLDDLAAVDVRAAYHVARNLSRVAADRFTERISNR
jgi:CRP-like cAMP-binding protein